MLVRVLAAGVALGLIRETANVFAWPIPVLTGAVLLCAIPFPGILVWLVGSYLLAIALELPSSLAAHGLLVLAGVVVYSGVRRAGTLQ